MKKTPKAVKPRKRNARAARQIVEQLRASEAELRALFAAMTVRKHVSNILSKLHLASRTQAALYALKEGIVSL